MVIAIGARVRYPIGFLILGSIMSLSSAPTVAAQTPNANNSSSTSTTPDAAAKAAERKKRFQDEEKRLENTESVQTISKPEPTNASPDDLSISPVLVNMLVHETQGFSLFDNAGHNLTSKAEWTLSNSYVADLTTNGVPTISTKDVGTVAVSARVGSRTAEASVTVHPGDRLPLAQFVGRHPRRRERLKRNRSSSRSLRAVAVPPPAPTQQKSTTPALFPRQNCDDEPAWVCWGNFRKTHSLKDIQARWMDFWKANQDKIYWDAKAAALGCPVQRPKDFKRMLCCDSLGPIDIAR